MLINSDSKRLSIFYVSFTASVGIIGLSATDSSIITLLLKKFFFNLDGLIEDAVLESDYLSNVVSL